jgi:dTDP-4-dehydrorhamnose reductase
MKIWVSGSGGLLGSSLCRLIPCIPSTKKEADIANLDSLRAFAKQHPGITHIVNCSAFSLVDLAETHRMEAYQINAIGPENLGFVAKEIGAKIVHISTDYVFPGDVFRPLHEEDQARPLNYYGDTKWEGERRLFSVFPSACVIRTSALFGRGGKNFVAKIFQMLFEKEEIYLADDQHSSPTFVEDLAQAILQMLDETGLYHFSNQGSATKFALGTAICHFAKTKGAVFKTKTLIPVPSATFPSPCQRPVYSVFNTAKIRIKLKTPIRSWEEVLHSFLGEIL